MTLRPYQLRAIDSLRRYANQRPILVAPPGAGKTTIAAEIIRLALSKQRRTAFLVHRIELLDQAVARLADFGITAGTVVPGRPITNAPVQVASIPTLARRKHVPAADLVIVDEAHHVMSRSWLRVLDKYNGAHVIGLTATPYRLDGQGLADAGFGAIVVACTVSDLIRDGYLVEPTVYAPAPPDLSGIQVRRGDYETAALAQRMSSLTGDIIAHWRKRADGLRTVGFGVNIEHSKLLAERFREAGVTAEHIDGTTPAAERAATLARLRSGTTLAVFNVQVLTEGWDLPALQCAILARPTKSRALHVQMIGRVMRACPDKTGAIILDHAGNSLEHGLVTDPIEFSLDSKIRRADTSAAPVKTCLDCYAIIPAQTVECPVCGATNPVKDRTLVETDGELVKLESGVAQRQFYERVVVGASLARYKLGWARNQFRNQFHKWPSFRDVEEALYVCPGHRPETVTYGWKRVTRCAVCYRAV